MIVPPIQLAQGNTFSWPDQRTAGFQKQACLMNHGHVSLIVVVKVSVGANFSQVFMIIHRSSDYFAGIGYRAKQLQTGQRHRRRVGCDRSNSPSYSRQIGDEDIIRGQGITVAG